MRLRLSKRRAPLVLMALAMGATVALAGCGSGGGSGSGGQVTITFWDDNGGPDRTPIYKGIIARFEKANPDIHVNYVGVPIDSVQQKYNTAIAGGSPPDVGSMSTTYIAGIIGQQALVPVDSQFKASPLNGKIVSSFLTETRDLSPDHKLYGIPYTGNSATLWYRSDWFQQAGLQAPKTWDDFFADAQALTNPAQKRYGFTLRGGSGSISPLVQYLYADSGITSFFVNNKSTINDPRNVAALTRLASIYDKDTPKADVNNDYPQMVAEFDGGSAAMMMHNLGSLSNHQKALPGKYASVPFPPGPDGHQNVVPNPLSIYGVFKAGKHQDQAWKFLEFLLSEQSNSQWNQTVGQVPANTDVRGEQWVKQTPSTQQALASLADPTTRTVMNPIYLPEYGSITQVDMPPLWQKVLLGQMTAKQFLDKFASELNDAQQKYVKRTKKH